MMNLRLVESKVTVKVENKIGNLGFSFFTSAEHGDVFFHLKDLTKNWFCEDDLVLGCTAIIDIEIEASGKQRTKHIHELNHRAGRPLYDDRPARPINPQGKKPAFSAGVSSRGKMKLFKEGYGFIQDSDHKDLFFALKCVKPNLIPFLEVGIDVRFTVETCSRGVMARISSIVWSESQLTRALVDSNLKKSLYIYRVTDPTDKNWLEIRHEPLGKKSMFIAEPKTLAVARRQIEKSPFIHLVLNRAKKLAV